MRAALCATALLVFMAEARGAQTAKQIPDELRIKREAVYEFAQKPTVTRDGDNVTIAFATKGRCDVTVAVEDADGRIIRHLASGVLGKNAPPPFQKDTLKQTVVWDGKNDQGVYVDDKDACTIRVSLGLRAQFEKTLYWSPHKRMSNMAPLLCPAPEGVYVHEGMGVDHLRLFSHEGEYIRTVYPFPRNKLDEVIGLQKRAFPHGDTLPLKLGFEQASLLSSGTSAGKAGGHAGGFAATAMDVWPRPGKPTRIALAYLRLNRLAGDGSSGGLPIRGPNTAVTIGSGRHKRIVEPTSAAFSPDGKTLYMAGYVYKTSNHYRFASCQHMVTRIAFETDKPMEVWLGKNGGDGHYGKKNDQFCVPTSVACDAKGRVYVGDYMNDRIQVFSPAGKYLKTIPTPKPAYVKVNPQTGEIWSFSFLMIGPSTRVIREYKFDSRRLRPTVARLGTFEKPEKPELKPLPNIDGSARGGWIGTFGQSYQCAVDWYAKEPTIWLVGRKATISLAEANWMGGGGQWSHLGRWDRRGIRLLRLKNGKWTEALDFAKVAKKKVHRLMPGQFGRARIYVNPTTGDLTVCEEQTGAGKSFYTVLYIDPQRGRIREQRLPFDAEDICYDINGLIYLRTDREVMRFNPNTWREVPWDYGEVRGTVRFAASGSIPSTRAISALPIPGHRPVWWHSSGMWVSPKGNLAIICNVTEKRSRKKEKEKYFAGGITTGYSPTEYPGRSGSRIVMVFDKHGKVVHEDAIPGLTNCDGLGIDRENNLYTMVAAPRIFNGEPYFDGKSQTLGKFTPGKVKLVSAGRAAVKLPESQYPNRPADFAKYGMGKTWALGAEWLYGGVGYGGQGGSCVCWHARFQLDDFGRSFAPEVMCYRVAVLDSAGNLILRIGRYGNVDDGVPIGGPGRRGEPPTQRKLGPPEDPRNVADEVAFAHAAYVGVHTDRRLFVHDAGNARIVGVRLGYHISESISLKNIEDRQK
jgi:hypothetical protein